jgi:hypothetical protein
MSFFIAHGAVLPHSGILIQRYDSNGTSITSPLAHDEQNKQRKFTIQTNIARHAPGERTTPSSERYRTQMDRYHGSVYTHFYSRLCMGPKQKKTDRPWPPRESRSRDEVLIDDANLVCRSYDGRHHNLKDRSSPFDLNDFLAPHLVLFFLKYKSEYKLCDLLTLSFEAYALLRKDDHVTRLIDRYLEKKKLLFPHSARTRIFSNHQGQALNCNHTRCMINQYTIFRFATSLQEIEKAYESEQSSASADHSSSASFPASCFQGE